MNMNMNMTITIFIIFAVAVMYTLCSLFGTAVVLLVWCALGFTITAWLLIRQMFTTSTVG